MKKLSELASRLIIDSLARLEAGPLFPVPQDHARATMAPLLRKEDGRNEWGRPAVEIHNRVRGLSPWPGAYSFLDGKLTKVLETKPADGTGEPGVLYVQGQDGLAAGTGQGLLGIMSLQPEGKRAMSAAEFLRGHRIEGKKFSNP